MKCYQEDKHENDVSCFKLGFETKTCNKSNELSFERIS